jgi:hypothetical protein
VTIACFNKLGWDTIYLFDFCMKCLHGRKRVESLIYQEPDMTVWKAENRDYVNILEIILTIPVMIHSNDQ